MDERLETGAVAPGTSPKDAVRMIAYGAASQALRQAACGLSWDEQAALADAVATGVAAAFGELERGVAELVGALGAELEAVRRRTAELDADLRPRLDRLERAELEEEP
jgi:hypothetical protein